MNFLDFVMMRTLSRNLFFGKGFTTFGFLLNMYSFILDHSFWSPEYFEAGSKI